ncbi:YtrH family sporulation protein [Paenibacillus thalictri]|uniref:Sporulation protein n=1 Tax=Paenibacillus thalictri TaxID=2527873 RepID=A0A4Q9DPA6_9BACL|nr:YtrH family sporulation protein [Paenibacillus thalictri]TBL75058.1 sporulation protein [Paenibacillus thalictri]
MSLFWIKMTECFFVAFGAVVGGTMLSGIGAVLILEPPSNTMLRISENIKIWALVAAVGGTIDPLRVIESHFLDGHISPAIKQILFFVSAFTGAQMGTSLIQWICKGGGAS